MFCKLLNNNSVYKKQYFSDEFEYIFLVSFYTMIKSISLKWLNYWNTLSTHLKLFKISKNIFENLQFAQRLDEHFKKKGLIENVNNVFKSMYLLVISINSILFNKRLIINIDYFRGFFCNLYTPRIFRSTLLRTLYGYNNFSMNFGCINLIHIIKLDISGLSGVCSLEILSLNLNVYLK